MRTVEIFEPAAGCMTGACGPDQEDTLAAFEATLEALLSRGVSAYRYNLGHDPDEFARSALVKAAIRQDGMACLPMVLVDGVEVCRGRYPSAGELAEGPAAP